MGVKKQVDSRIRTLIENGVYNRHRSFFVIVGDHGKDQVRAIYLYSIFSSEPPTTEWRGIVLAVPAKLFARYASPQASVALQPCAIGCKQRLLPNSLS